MSKDEWLSDKIATLIDEGKPRDQAVAIANSMWREEHDGDKSLDDGCFKKALDKHLEAGMMATDAEAKARSECTDDAPDPGEKAFIRGCVDDRAKRYEDAGMTPVLALMRAEEDCVDARRTTPAPMNTRKDFAFSDDPNWLTPEAENRIWERLKARLGDALESIGFGRKSSDEVMGFKVAGNHWWITSSNNFKDRDGEVFPQKAIDAYVARVDNGLVKPPELWVWHMGKSVAIGSADWVARHGHFAVAAGQFYGAQAAQAAKAYYTRHAAETGVSHGFTFPAEQFKDGQFHQFNTFEISLLPRGAEANLYTSLEGVKDMALTDQKKKYLADVFGKEHADRILASLDERGKALEELGVEFKDFTDTELAAGDKETTADKAAGELMLDALEGSGQAITAATEAVKAVKALREEMADLKTHVGQTLDQRPRQASREEVTELDPDKHKELYDKVKNGSAVYDNWWGRPVKQNVGGS